MTLANLAKFILGVSLAIAIMISGSIVGGLYFMYQVTARPPKPVFTNERATTKAASSPSGTTAPKPVFSSQSSAQLTPSKDASLKPLEPGAYRARVNWEQGLSLRSDPNMDAERVGGLEHQQQIVVLEESADKNWQRVRLADGEQEGWIKAGNIERE